MLSIIICSRDAQALQTVTQNVEQTVGVPYEIIGINNSGGHYGICEAYNVGAAQSNYDHLCFMHEDLCFHTPDWGKVVLAILADAAIGVLGVAGGTYMAKAPGGWFSPPDVQFRRMNVTHTVGGHATRVDLRPTTDSLFAVAAVDGLWMCCRKEVWTKFKFDAVVFSAFHFYDVDFCTRVFTKYKNYVTFDVSIEHFSVGSQNNSWYENATTYYRKRQSYLPFGSVKLSGQEDKKVTLQVFQQFISGYIDNNLSFGRGIRLISDYLLLASFNRESLGLLKKYLKKKILR